MENIIRNFSIFIVSHLDKYYPRSEIEKIKMRYGMEIVLDNMIKIIGYGVISSFLGCLKETTIVLLIFGLLRLCAGGVHMNSSLTCFFATGFVAVGGSIVSLHYQANQLFFVFVMILQCILTYIYAPSGTIEHPVKEEEKKKLKYRSLFLLFLYIILGLCVSDINMTLILVGSGCEIISILPFVNTKYRQTE